LRNAAREGRAAAMSRRWALAAGKTALAPTHERVRTVCRESKLRAPTPAAAVTPPAAPTGQGASSAAQWAMAATAVDTDIVAAARLGRALSMQRRRQMSQGKQALNGVGAGARAFIVYPGGAR
nr:hypothetical protein [Actinomycetota bacterium]